MRKMLENGVHFGHQTRKWNPQMKPFIYTAKNNVYIIDLAKTQEQLEKAYDALKKIAEDGGKILFVGTKKQAQATILEEAIRSGSFYVNQRWLGGTLTNFRTIQKSIKKLVDIEEMEANGTIQHYTKKEQALMLKQKDKLENFLGGIKEMKKLPDALFVVDPLEEHNAVDEARKLNIPVFALIDTNADPTKVTYPIPSNDDAVRSIKLMVSLVADAIVEAKGGVLEAAHQEEEGLRLDGSPHRDEVTRTEVGTARHVELDGLAALELEDVGAVEEAHIDTAGVGRVVVYDPVVAGGELRSGNHILHHRTVLDFRHADDNRVILVLSGDVEEHALQVADFARVLGRVPALRPVGRELLVEHVGVGNRIEQVLEVVEDHFIGLLRETGHEQHGKQSCKKNFLHHKAIEFDSIQVRISCIGCISC